MGRLEAEGRRGAGRDGREVALAANGFSMMIAGNGSMPAGSRSVALKDAVLPLACTVTVSVLPLRTPVTLVGAVGRCPYSCARPGQETGERRPPRVRGRWRRQRHGEDHPSEAH